MSLKSTFGSLLLAAPVWLSGADLPANASAALAKGVAFFQTISSHGGYVYHVTPDLSQRWGEGPKDADTIEVQPPGTPAVGQAFLRAYKATGNEQALVGAKAAAEALIRGQNRHGGWDHTINFADLSNETVSLDDNQSQSAVSFLLALNQIIDDPGLAAATQRAMAMMLKTQLDHGGWPHLYPNRGNYHDFATFNDGGINDCIRVMIEAHLINPEDQAIETSLRQAARFMVISQLPPPQPGWAQQYNEFLQPAWARTFEPASVCPAVTVRNLGTLIDLFVALGDETLLEPIPDAIRWLHEIQMPNGKWARFVEIGTNKALYYDRGRIRVNSIAELHPERATGYAYETDLTSALTKATQRYRTAIEGGRAGLARVETPELSPAQVANRLQVLAKAVEKIIAAQDPSGAWITRNDRFKTTMPSGVRWSGQYTVLDRISSATFNANVALLCEYIELSAR